MTPDQQATLDRLRTETATRDDHDRFVDQLLTAAAAGEILDDLPLPPGVSARYAAALIEDVEWCTADHSGPGYPAPFPAAYTRRRLTDARAAAARRRTRAHNDVWSGLRIT